MNNLRNNTDHSLNAKMLSWLSRMLIMGVCLSLVLIIGIQACNSPRALDGTYVNTAGSEFSIAHDTLIVEHEQGQRYFLHRRTGFQLLDDSGKPGMMQHEKEEWTAVYDPETEIMTESRKGKLITFDVVKGIMTVGNANTNELNNRMMNARKIMMRIFKTYMVVLPLSATVLLTALPSGATAQLAIAEVIKAGVKKVIKAVDLKVQRLQNETIWLQNAQKVIENQLNKLKLSEISEWTERQRSLYSEYYESLVKVKSVISAYKRIKDLANTQAAIVQEYRWASGLFRKEKHFSASELLHMEEVYEGILKASVKNLDQVFVVINSFKTQMSDAKRMELINEAAEKMDENFSDLRQFNDQNITLSIQRSKSVLESKTLKELYDVN